MTNIDIVTLTGLTATDGSILDAGAVIKFETEFPIGFAGFHARIKAYRNRTIFEAGYEGIALHGIIDELTEDMGVEFFNLTPTILYTKVADYINNEYSATVCEVQITN